MLDRRRKPTKQGSEIEDNSLSRGQFTSVCCGKQCACAECKRHKQIIGCVSNETCAENVCLPREASIRTGRSLDSTMNIVTTNPISRAAECGKLDETPETLSNPSAEEIKEYVAVLQGGFKEPVPFSCACFRPASKETTFGHFEQSGRLSARIAEINLRLHERSKLALLKDCFLRLQTSTEFVSELEVTAEGYSTFSRQLFEACDDSVREEFPFKAERFRDICQRAKAQLRHWSAIRQAIFADSFLRKSVADVLHDLQIVKRELQQQGKSCILWIGSILSCVIRIAESCQWRLSQEVLRSIFRGVEDYNRLCEYLEDVTGEVESVFSLDEANVSAHDKMCLSLNRCHVNTFTPGLGICAISLNKFLNGVAHERSNILARHVHRFLCENEQINRTSKYDCTSKFEWKDFCLDVQPRNGVVTVATTNSITHLKLDPEAPLLSFDSTENEFVSSMISQLANATTLMLKTEKRTLLQKSGQKEHLREHLPTIQHDTESVSHGILKQSGSVSLSLNKRVQWLAPLDGRTKGHLCLQYMAMIWSHFGLTLFQELEEPTWKAEQWQNSVGPLPLWSDAMLLSAGSLLESLHVSGCLPPVGSQSIQAVSQRIHWQASHSSFNSGYSKLLSVSLKDKCQSDSECTENCPMTMTVQAVVALLDPLNSFFEVASSWNQSASWREPTSSEPLKLPSTLLLSSVSQLQSLLTFCLSWFGTKLNSVLSSRCLKPFFLLTHWDFPCLLSSFTKTVKLLQPVCSSAEAVRGWRVLHAQWLEVQDAIGKLEGLAKGFWGQFCKWLNKLSVEFFQEAMPKGKSWRKSRHGGIPFQHNSYAEHVVSELLAPVVVSIVQLPQDTQLEILTYTVNTLMKCWGDHILREDIIFSYYGAQQLQLDFNRVKFWIAAEENGLSCNIQSNLLSLDIFRNLDGAASLLLLQPRKKKKQSAELDVELESNMSAISSSSVLSSLSGADLDGYDIDVLNDRSIPNSEQWLSLRLRGGKSKKGLLPFCLKVQEMK